MKTCPKCERDLPFSEFYVDKSKPLGISSYCKDCAKQKARDWTKENPRAARRLSREWAAKNPEKRHATLLKFHYQMEYGEYTRMLEEQGGECAICRTPSTVKKLVVDHCHATNRIRGLLCSACNCALGFLGDADDLYAVLGAYFAENPRESKP